MAIPSSTRRLTARQRVVRIMSCVVGFCLVVVLAVILGGQVGRMHHAKGTAVRSSELRLISGPSLAQP